MALRLLQTPWLRGLAMGGGAAAVGLLAGVNPKLAIGAAVGCGFLILAFANLTVATAVFGFLSFVEVVPLGGSIVNVTKLAGLVLALSWFAFIATRERTDGNFFSSFPLISFVLALFLLWSLLSVLWAENEAVALGSTIRYALNAVLFLIVFAALRKPQDIKLLAAAFLAGAATAAAYGLLNPADEIELGRLGSSVLDPNQLASVLVAGLPLSVALAYIYRKDPAGQAISLVAGVFCLISLCLTVSRGGLIALGVSLVAAILLGGRWRPAILGLALATVTLTAAYFTLAAPEASLQRITKTTRGEAEVTEGRTTIWQVGWRIVEENPVKGIGAGNFQDAAPHYLLQPGALGRTDTIIGQPSAAHNTYLQVLAEGGAIGLALFLVIIAFSIGVVLRAASLFKRRAEDDMEVLARAFAIALIGTLVADFFLSQEFSKQLWLLLGICPAILAIARKPQAAEADSRQPSNPGSTATLPQPSAA